jgi:hypothetical protein
MVSRIKKGLKNMRDKANDALYKLYTPQEHHPKAKIFNKEHIKPGNLLIRFNKRKPPKKMPTVEEIMKKEEAKLEKKKAKKKSKKKRRKYGEKTRKGKKRFLKKMKKKKKNKRGGRRTRKKRGGEGDNRCNCQEGDKFTLKDEGYELYEDQGIYEITKILNNYVYFNHGEPGGDDEKNVIITQLRNYFEPYNQQAPGPGGRKKKRRRRRRTKKKRRRRR